MKECAYQSAEILFSKANYTDARSTYKKLANYKDSADKEKLCVYTQAEIEFASNNYSTAEELYSQITGYEDSDAKLTVCRYQMAEALYASGEYEQAQKLYTDLNYEDSEEKILLCLVGQGDAQLQQGNTMDAAKLYVQAISLEEAQEKLYAIGKDYATMNMYTEAIKCLYACGDYEPATKLLSELAELLEMNHEDVLAFWANAMLGNTQACADLMESVSLDDVAKVSESFNNDLISDPKGWICYVYAETCLSMCNYDGATKAFTKAGNYEDASTQALAAQYIKGETLLAAGDYDGATQAFTNAGEYSDAAIKITECQYQKANALKAAESYVEAGSIFNAIRGYKDVDNIIETDENISAAAHAACIAQYEVGNTVTMGTYGGEAIEWLVLAEDGNCRVMITVKGQDAVCFNKSDSYENEWKSSYVRTWLNDTFYNTAFSEEEKATITAGPTNDNVWLLSVEEAEQYFASNDDRICYPTQTAKDHGADTEDSGACWWWLRSPGTYSYGVANVFANVGDVNTFGNGIHCTTGCVRPVVVLRLS